MKTEYSCPTCFDQGEITHRRRDWRQHRGPPAGRCIGEWTELFGKIRCNLQKYEVFRFEKKTPEMAPEVAVKLNSKMIWKQKCVNFSPWLNS